MSTLETTVTIEATLPSDGTGGPRLTGHTKPSPGEIDGESLPNVAKRLDNFSILRKLGSGAMGVVYAAFDESLNRQVAIKLLRPHLGTHNTRFVREAQGLARLSHPNVVQVYQVGTYDNRLFIAMEFVAGKTLRNWLDEGPHGREDILRVFRDAGRGLAAAHGANLVHRDFKPDNVMVGDDGRVRVMDFGLVHEDGGDLEELLSSTGGSNEEREIVRRRLDSALNLELTQPGSLLGTPAYMAPEQHLGRPTDARADQFSFCVALWEALYGKRPFVGESWQDLIENVTNHNIVEPKRNDVPNWLRAVIERGLATEPVERWDSMDELLDALDEDPTHKRRVLVASAAAATLLIGSVVGYQVNQTRKHEAEQAAVAAAAQALDERCTAEAESIHALWSRPARMAVSAAMLGLDHPIAKENWERTQRLLDDYVEDWASMRKQVCVQADEPGQQEWGALASACLDQGKRDFASRIEVLSAVDDESGLMNAVLAVGRQQAPDTCIDADVLRREIRLPDESISDEVEAVQDLISEASANLALGRVPMAKRKAAMAVQEAERIGWEPLVADALYWRGNCAMAKGELEDGERDLREALSQASESNPHVAILAASSLTHHLRFAHNDRALIWGEVGELLITLSHTEGSIVHAKLLSDIGTAEALNSPERAIGYFDRALELSEPFLAEGHPDHTKVLNNLAVAYTDAERYAEALEVHKRVLELRERSLPANHPDIGYSAFGLGRVYNEQGKARAAIEALERALEIFELSKLSRESSVTLLELGEALALDGQQTEAQRKFEQALELTEEIMLPPSFFGRLYFNLARICWSLDERDEARTHGARARERFAGDPNAADKLAEVDEWLASRTPPA